MARPRPPSPAARASGYSLALGSVLLALSVKWLLEPYTGASSPFLPFLAAIMVTAWFGGLAAGAVATVVSALVVEYFFILETPSGMPRSPGAVTVLFFICEALLIAYATAYIVRARADAVRRHQRSEQELGLHFGLASVRDRMGTIGGAFEIDSASGRGTTMRLRLPMKHTRDQHVEWDCANSPSHR